MQTTTESAASVSCGNGGAESHEAHVGRSRRGTTRGPAAAIAAPRSAAIAPIGRIGVPTLPRAFAARERLIELLGDARSSRIVLVAAPPGYGKSALLADWANRGERSFAWLTLGGEHNDPLRLLASIGLALERQGLDSAAALAEPVPVCVGATEESATLAELMRAAEAQLGAAQSAQTELVLVLDDLQVIRDKESLNLIAYLAEVMPERSTLVLASRTRPAMQLGRLRARHGLTVLGARDLATTDAEAAALLGAAGLELERATVKRLVTGSEGWPAALALAGASLVGGKREIEAQREPDHDRIVFDYVATEVLEELTTKERAFLASASVLEELSADVCNTVLDRADSGSMLRAAASASLLVEPVGHLDPRQGVVYRCHPLLRRALQEELATLDPALRRELHRRASASFEEHGDIERAVEHAAAAGDAGGAGRLLRTHAARFMMRGRAPALQRWLSCFTEQQLAGSAELATCAAHAWLEMGDLDRAEHWTRVAATALERGVGDDEAGGLAASIGIARALIGRHGVERAGEEARDAYELDEDPGYWRAAACLMLGVARHLAGHRPEARAALSEGVNRGAVVAPLVESLCLAQLALMCAEDGDWKYALELATRAGERVERAGLAGEPLSALVLATAAWLLARAGRGDDAKRRLKLALRLLEGDAHVVPWCEVEVCVMLARASIQLADVSRARGLLSRASRAARRVPDAPVFHAWLDDGWAQIDETGAAALSGPSSLTMAELRILRFLPTHLSFREIGGRLHVSTNTVKSQAHAVYSKLGAASRSEAVAQASELGLIDVLVT
jgi:LuxR family maltose regulon positive regulatory protein